MSRGSTTRARASPMRCRLAPRELVRVKVDNRSRHSDFVQQLLYPGDLLVFVADRLRRQWFSQDRQDPHPGVQGRIGILEHQLELTTLPTQRLA